MSAIAAQRARFAATAVTTATPQALVVMLYERLVLDLQRGELAQRDGQLAVANTQLQHAQDIITELDHCLDVDVWDGGPALRALYTWLLTELVQANITNDPDRTAACRTLVEPLRDAWREAVSGGASTGTSTGTSTAGGATVGTSGPQRDSIQVTA